MYMRGEIVERKLGYEILTGLPISIEVAWLMTAVILDATKKMTDS